MILVQSASANMAPHDQAAEAEPLSAIEFAIVDFIGALRATAQFAADTFTGLEKKLATPNVELTIEDPMSVSRSGTP